MTVLHQQPHFVGVKVVFYKPSLALLCGPWVGQSEHLHVAKTVRVEISNLLTLGRVRIPNSFAAKLANSHTFSSSHFLGLRVKIMPLVFNPQNLPLVLLLLVDG